MKQTPINEEPDQQSPGYRMTLDRLYGDRHAAAFADALDHSCFHRALAAGSNKDPYWKCRTCGSRVELQTGLDIARWVYDMELRR